MGLGTVKRKKKEQRADFVDDRRVTQREGHCHYRRHLADPAQGQEPHVRRMASSPIPALTRLFRLLALTNESATSRRAPWLIRHARFLPVRN